MLKDTLWVLAPGPVLFGAPAQASTCDRSFEESELLVAGAAVRRRRI